jgi:hypothetical protein
MAQPEFEHGEEVCVFFIARGEASEVFESIEETLDEVARLIECRTEARFPAAVDHWRDIGRGTGSLDVAAQPISVIGLIGEHHHVLAQVPEQVHGDQARRQNQFEGQPVGIDERVDFGYRPATRAARIATRVAFFEFAAC